MPASRGLDAGDEVGDVLLGQAAPAARARRSRRLAQPIRQQSRVPLDERTRAGDDVPVGVRGEDVQARKRGDRVPVPRRAPPRPPAAGRSCCGRRDCGHARPSRRGSRRATPRETPAPRPSARSASRRRSARGRRRSGSPSAGLRVDPDVGGHDPVRLVPERQVGTGLERGGRPSRGSRRGSRGWQPAGTRRPSSSTWQASGRKSTNRFSASPPNVRPTPTGSSALRARSRARRRRSLHRVAVVREVVLRERAARR